LKIFICPPELCEGWLKRKIFKMNTRRIYHNIFQSFSPLTLLLFMLGIAANHPQDSLALDDLTVIANPSD